MKTTDLWPILRLISLILFVPAVMAGISVAVAWAAGDMIGAFGFAVTAGFALGLGASLYWLLPAGHHPDFRETMVGCAAGWLAAALIGSLPFMIVAYWSPAEDIGAAHVFLDFWNAFFESMSGFTTTGLTQVRSPSMLPVSLQWWRSLTQWVGGAGVIVLVLAVVQPGQEVSKLFRAEGHERPFGHSVVSTVRQTWWIYLSFTILGVALLRMLGMTLWESVNHAMTAVSTGGFTVTDDSLGNFGHGARAGVTLLTILGAISFVWHRRLVEREWLKCLQDPQTLTLFCVLAAGAVLLVVTRYAGGNLTQPFVTVLHWTSAVTTSGFAAEDVEGWSGASKMLLVLAMIAGGCTGSAAGGVKLLRIAALFREVTSLLRTIVLKPWLLIFRPATLAVELDAEVVGRFTVAALLVGLWLLVIVIAGFAVALLAGPDIALTDSIFDVVSALSITGLSTGVAQAEIGVTGKAIFILLMWMGRLEIIPVLVFVAWLSGLRPDSDGKGAAA